MTFTNKAALEMKERIISALDQISREKNQNSGIKILAETLATEIGISPEEVNKRSKKVLESILHQYEDFNVMTIDKFNLRLIKSFARDLDLPSEFEVVLDETEIIEKIVDDLLNQLGNEKQSALSQILMKYAKSNIDDGDSWNFRRSLIDFGKVLRNEKNNASIERLMELNLSIDVHKELYAVNAAIDKRFKGLCTSIAEKMSLIDPSVLPGKKSTFNQISTILRNEKFPLATELVKKQLSQNLEKEFPDNINRDLLELNTYWEKTLQDYGTVHLFLNNFFNMALLQ